MLEHLPWILVKLVAYPVVKTVETIETIGGAIGNAIEYVTTTEEERKEKRRKEEERRREEEYRRKCEMIKGWYITWFYGAFFLVVFGFVCFMFFIYGSGWINLIGSFILFAIAIACVFFGWESFLVARRCEIYLPIIISRDESMKIMLTEIAEMCNVHTHIVVSDIQRMISNGVIEGYILDFKRNLLLNAKLHAQEGAEAMLPKKPVSRDAVISGKPIDNELGEEFPEKQSKGLSGTEYLVERLNRTADTFKSAFGFNTVADVKDGSSAPEKPEKVAKNCAFCGAPISGNQGQVVFCEYCNTDNKYKGEEPKTGNILMDELAFKHPNDLEKLQDIREISLEETMSDIITVRFFDEHTVVAPGRKQTNNGSGSNNNCPVGVISNGSRIFVREDTAAFIFSESGIEEIITTPGGHTYQSDKTSASNVGGIEESFIDQAVNFFGFGSRTSSQKQIAFVNLREIRGIKFGTRDPLSYNDLCYGTDLKIFAFGTFSIKVTDAEKFIRNYVPANVAYYSFNGVEAKERIMSEFLRFFADALSALSATYRILLLPSQMNEISRAISADSDIAGTWQERFGFEILEVDIQNMEFSEDSRELVLQYS